MYHAASASGAKAIPNHGNPGGRLGSAQPANLLAEAVRIVHLPILSVNEAESPNLVTHPAQIAHPQGVAAVDEERVHSVLAFGGGRLDNRASPN